MPKLGLSFRKNKHYFGMSTGSAIWVLSGKQSPSASHDAGIMSLIVSWYSGKCDHFNWLTHLADLDTSLSFSLTLRNRKFNLFLVQSERKTLLIYYFQIISATCPLVLYSSSYQLFTTLPAREKEFELRRLNLNRKCTLFWDKAVKRQLFAYLLS